MFNVLDKTDPEIKTDVLSELKSDPSLKVTEIGVLVTDGIVTLTGYTTSFDEKLAAVHAVKRVNEKTRFNSIQTLINYGAT
jgi:osmotically-inducible protein OsmY